MPLSKANVKLVCHDAKACIVSLLTDPQLMDHDYLFYNDDPTASPPIDPPSQIGDIHTAGAHRAAVFKYKKDPKHVVLPIIMYIDGSETGAMKSMPITALKITLGIFCRQYRDQPHAWRTLGYVPSASFIQSRAKKVAMDSGHMSSTNIELADGEGAMTDSDLNTPKGLATSHDLHAMLDKILESYHYLQDNGFKWDLRYKGKVWNDLTFIPYVLFMKSDAKEADGLCGSDVHSA